MQNKEFDEIDPNTNQSIKKKYTALDNDMYLVNFIDLFLRNPKLVQLADKDKEKLDKLVYELLKQPNKDPKIKEKFALLTQEEVQNLTGHLIKVQTENNHKDDYCDFYNACQVLP